MQLCGFNMEIGSFTPKRSNLQSGRNTSSSQKKTTYIKDRKIQHIVSLKELSWLLKGIFPENQNFPGKKGHFDPN
jgi:hypothetical protein